MSAPSTPDLTDLLACPLCGAPVPLEDGSVTCAHCGPVAVLWHGIVDFLRRTARLPGAAGGDIDLRLDEGQANDLGQLGVLDRADLEIGLAGLRERARDDIYRRRRSARRAAFDKTQLEVGLAHGGAILSKVADRMAERGLGTPAPGMALEAGGGFGLHVPDLARRFHWVVLVDCSLANLVVASAVMREAEVTNVLLVRADVQRLPFRDAVFGYVQEYGVIEHVPDPVAMIREAIRVVAPGGIYVCMSPNRFSLLPEPHFLVPAFGFIPRYFRAPLIRRASGIDSEAGTEPRSLSDLRAYFAAAGAPDVDVFFLPRELSVIARRTLIRRLVRALLQGRITGRLTAWILNRLLLPIVPYHIALLRRPP